MLKTKEDFYEYLLREGKSEKTANIYYTSLKIFENKHFEYTFESICEWKNYMINSFKPTTVNLRIQAMNEFLQFNHLEFKISTLKLQTSFFKENELTEEQYKRLLKGLIKDKRYKWYIIIKILATTGIRISELLQIEAEQISRGYVDVIGKGNKVRRVWFPQKLRKEVSKYIDYSGPIAPYSNNYIRTKLHQFAEDYNIPKDIMHPHEFRSFFAKKVYAQTKDIKLLQDLLGHTNISTTALYLRKTSSYLGDQISQIVNW